MTRPDVVRRALLYKPNLDRVFAETFDRQMRVGANDHARLTARLATELKVTQQTKNLFMVAWRDQDPGLARDALQTLLTIFVESTAGGGRTEWDSGRRFLERQIQSYEQKLRAAEKRRADFRVRYGELFSIDLGANGGDLEKARRAVPALEGRLADATLRRDAVRRERDNTPPMLTAEAGTSQPVPNPDYAQWTMRATEADAEVSALTRQRDRAQTDVKVLEKIATEQPGLIADFQQMDRDYNALRKNYEELLGRLQSANVIQPLSRYTLDKVRIQIIDPPERPRVPVAPNRTMLNIRVLLLGLAIGCFVNWARGIWPRNAVSRAAMITPFK